MTERIGWAASDLGLISGPLDVHVNEPGSDLSWPGREVPAAAGPGATARAPTATSRNTSPLTNVRMRGVLIDPPSREGKRPSAW
ncbi:hypothetical protein [Streptomyces sp. NPDC055506]